MSASRPLSNAAGLGGQPGMTRSTGTTLDAPPAIAVTARKDAAVRRTGATRDDPFGRRRRVIGSLQRLAHVQGDRSSHQKNVGMPRRRDEAKAEPLKIVESVAERVDFEFAGVARTGVDVADSETSPERPLGRRFHGRGESQELGIVVRGRVL